MREDVVYEHDTQFPHGPQIVHESVTLSLWHYLRNVEDCELVLAVLSLSASKASSGQRWRKGPRPASTCYVDVVGELQLYDRPTLEHIPLQETIRLVRLSVNLHALKYELVL